MSDYQDDTEISLGAGKLLVLFFGLVILCGAFFGVGYMIGKNSSPLQVASAGTDSAPAGNGLAKPSSSINSPQQAKAQDCATPGNCDQPTAGSDLTFYKNVERKDPQPQLEPAPAPMQPASAATETKPVAKAPAPEMPKAISPGTGYLVQVAAVSKQQDADALVTYLRKKQYPVFVTNNPPNDKLFHVQAGPFADIKEAEAVKARLINDGYSPILKR